MPNEMTLLEELEARRSIGGLLSNVCYNLVQIAPQLGEHVLNQLNQLRERWDAIPRTSSIQLLELQDAAKDQLRQLMSDLSEEYWCAGWLSGLEKDLWERAFLGKHNEDFGNRPIDLGDLEKLRSIARNTNSWWIWDDKLIDQRCITFEEACQMFGRPGAQVCNCPPPNEYTLPSYNCPVHQNIGRQK